MKSKKINLFFSIARRSSCFFIILILGSCSGGGDSSDNSADVCSAAKVINGTKCGTPSDSPILRFVISDIALCTGTLIAPNKLLTAAHCILDVPASEYRVVGKSFDDIIALGNSVSVAPGFAAAQRAVENDTATSTTDPAKLENEATRYFAGHSLPDIAVITLDRALPRRTLPVSKSYLPQAGDAFRAYGFGDEVKDDQNFPDKPSVAELINIFTGKTNFISKFVTQGLCHGDSGGPTIVQFGDGQDVVTGVTDAVASATQEDECTPGNLLLFSSTVSNLAFLRRAAPDADYR